MTGPVTGRPLTRVDGRLKVTGLAKYAADADVDGIAYAVIVGATIARGTVDGVDSATARRVPGIVDVITDFGGVKLPYDPTRVSAFGQAVAVVVGTSLEAATHAASLVSARYTAQTQLTDLDSTEVTPIPPSDLRETQPPVPIRDYSRGDADAALRTASVVADLRFALERNNHNPMEVNATVARWDGDRLTVWDKVQSVSGAAKDYAAALNVPVDHVRVLSPFVGGAFGNAGFTWPHQLIAAFTARRLRQPVKLMLTRRQLYHVTGYRPRSRQRVAIGADATGRIAAIVHESLVEVSKYRPYVDDLTAPARSLYAAPSMRSTFRVAELDVNQPKHMRGPGYISGAFTLESTLDDLAHRLSIDPIELRVVNEPTQDPATGAAYSTRRLVECLRSGAAAFGWSRRNPVPGSVREGNLLIGTGVAAAGFPTQVSPCSAAVRIGTDGRAEIRCGTSDIGPGTYTAVAQIAADALGLPMSRVDIVLGDSSLPVAPAQNGSRTMASVGSSVQNACAVLRDRFVRMSVVDPGSPLQGRRPPELDVIDGRMLLRDDVNRGERYEDLLRRRGLAELGVQQDWAPGDASTSFSIQAYGAVFAEVAVDDALGTVRVRRVSGFYDAGRIVNPVLARSQAIGGMVGGIGMALLEGTTLDHRDGRVVNANMTDYLVPVNADIPQLETVFLPGNDFTADPIGVKGIGELMIVPVPPAIANAVFNATGRRVTDLPITLDKLL
ncbi:MAG: xanthine dehydrogenase family protein molybdopterin-binding subunit [Mycobacterium sp.]